MNDQTREKPKRLEIHVEQWKRDIQTFADTTSQALNAIAAELSNDCSTVGAGRDTCNDPKDSDSPSASLSGKESEGQRLAKLKSQLAERLSKSN